MTEQSFAEIAMEQQDEIAALREQLKSEQREMARLRDRQQIQEAELVAKRDPENVSIGEATDVIVGAMKADSYRTWNAVYSDDGEGPATYEVTVQRMSPDALTPCEMITRKDEELSTIRESLRRIVSEHNDNGGYRYSAELGKAIKAGAEVLAEMEGD